MMQLSQSRQRDSRFTNLHAQANNWIQHPRGDHRDQASTVVHVDYTAWAASFAISIANLPPVKWMPKIVNLYFLTDMGRMSGESQWGASSSPPSSWITRSPDA